MIQLFHNSFLNLTVEETYWNWSAVARVIVQNINNKIFQILNISGTLVCHVLVLWSVGDGRKCLTSSVKTGLCDSVSIQNIYKWIIGRTLGHLWQEQRYPNTVIHGLFQATVLDTIWIIPNARFVHSPKTCPFLSFIKGNPQLPDKSIFWVQLWSGLIPLSNYSFFWVRVKMLQVVSCCRILLHDC